MTARTGSSHSNHEAMDQSGGMLNGFEVYEASRAPISISRPHSVVIQKNGMFSISSDLAIHLLANDDGGIVKLAYNRTTRQVAILPAKQGERGTLRITRPKGHRWFVDGRRFLKFYAICDVPVAELVTLEAEWQEESDGGKGAIIFHIPQL